MWCMARLPPPLRHNAVRPMALRRSCSQVSRPSPRRRQAESRQWQSFSKYLAPRGSLASFFTVFRVVFAWFRPLEPGFATFSHGSAGRGLFRIGHAAPFHAAGLVYQQRLQFGQVLKHETPLKLMEVASARPVSGSESHRTARLAPNQCLSARIYHGFIMA